MAELEIEAEVRGGFDATITDYKWQLTASGEYLRFALTYRKDGAEVDSNGYDAWFVGKAQGYTISEDGKTLLGRKGLPSGDFTRNFMSHFAGTNPLGDGEGINVLPLIGRRVRLGYVVDEKDTAKRGQRTGSDGKLYDRTKLVLVATYGAAVKADKSDLLTIAADSLVTIAKSGDFKRGSIAIKLPMSPKREDIRKFLANDEQFAAAIKLAGVTYNAATGVISEAVPF